MQQLKKMSYKEQIDFSRIPQHVAINVDVNVALDTRPVQKLYILLQKKPPGWVLNI